jgi:hypothetical protein
MFSKLFLRPQPMRGTPLSRFARIQRLQRHADTRLKHSNFYCAVKCSCSAATLRQGLCSFLPRTVPLQDIAMDVLISRAVAIARIVADCSQVSAELLLLSDRHHRQQFKQRPTRCVPSFCECSPLRCARCSLRCRVRPGGYCQARLTAAEARWEIHIEASRLSTSESNKY